MTDPTGGTIANLGVSALKRIAMAATQGPAAVAAQVEAIAASMGVSTAAVVRGVAVAVGSGSKAVAGWGATATAAVKGAVDAGVLVVSESVAGAAASAGATGLVGWFTGLTVGAKVAVVVVAVAGAVGIGRAAGWLASDSPSALPGMGPGTTAEFGPTASTPQSGFQGIGVYSNGALFVLSVRGTQEIAAGIPSCRFRHGGTDCTGAADVRGLTEVFPTAAEASQALCSEYPGPISAPPLADGWVLYLSSGSVTLDDWGSIDWAVCEAALQ